MDGFLVFRPPFLKRKQGQFLTTIFVFYLWEKKAEATLKRPCCFRSKIKIMSKKFKLFLLLMCIYSLLLNIWGCSVQDVQPEQFTLTAMTANYPFSDGTYREFARLELLFEGHPKTASINGERIAYWCKFEGFTTLHRDLDLVDGDRVEVNGQVKYYTR